MIKQKELYSRKSPCNSCPYRMDTPLQHWSIEEFRNLLIKDNDYFSVTYKCHKNDGCVCVGWLMNQDKRNHPSIALRLSLIKHKVGRNYLDSLSCKSEMYESVEEMCFANYPQLKSE